MMKSPDMTEPADAAFTLSEMAVSLFLASLVLLLVAEVSRHVTRSYVSVRTNLDQTRNDGRIALWISQADRIDPFDIEYSGRDLSAHTGRTRMLDYSLVSAGPGEGTSLLVQRDADGVVLRRRFELGGTAQLVWNQPDWVSIDFEDPIVPDFVQRVERNAPYDCRFDFVSRRCRS
ncbi:MAG: hypothetical protein P8P99_04065 [Maricaulis sp.]|nr:hypothetical protein [Maricaulis sp.]